MGPRHAGSEVRARAFGLVFPVKRSFVIGVVVPDAPAFRSDMSAEPAIAVDHLGIGTPGAPEKDTASRIFAGQAAALEDEAAGLGGIRSGLRRHVALTFTVDLTLAKHGGGIPK